MSFQNIRIGHFAQFLIFATLSAVLYAPIHFEVVKPMIKLRRDNSTYFSRYKELLAAHAESDGKKGISRKEELEFHNRLYGGTELSSQAGEYPRGKDGLRLQISSALQRLDNFQSN